MTNFDEEKNKKNVINQSKDEFQDFLQGSSNQMPNSDMGKYEEMRDSYEASAWYSKTKLRKENPELADALESVKKSNVIVVSGEYDKCELILDMAEIPYSLVSTSFMENLTLSPHQILFINCPGYLGDKALSNIKKFVVEGGLLITTDWALTSVIEKNFPETIIYNKNPTSDDVVKIQVKDSTNSIVSDFLKLDSEPMWWLEGSSYPIKIINPEQVRVLIYSDELKEKYGESPVIVEFNWYEGKVIHMISHFYLQRTETRGDKSRASASTVVEGSVYDEAPDEIKEKFKTITTEQFIAAQSSVSFIQKNIAEQTKKFQKNNEKEKSED